MADVSRARANLTLPPQLPHCFVSTIYPGVKTMKMSRLICFHEDTICPLISFYVLGPTILNHPWSDTILWLLRCVAKLKQFIGTNSLWSLGIRIDSHTKRLMLTLIGFGTNGWFTRRRFGSVFNTADSGTALCNWLGLKEDHYSKAHDFNQRLQ